MKYVISRLIASTLTIGILMFGSTAPVLAGSPSSTCPNASDSKGQVLQGIGQTGSNCDSGGVANAAKTAVMILSYVAGIAAVIMIVVSGLKFLTSGGDSNAVSSAKNTLVYALVGLVIVAIAQVIVHFVLNAIINNTVNGS